ncbi:MAG: type II secretion system secretin GspD [Gammaproteobacteria bacterium]|nr:type II secretion system secretin GspD [Gammaproteobacteria bacterium]MBV9620368.1 type II secretion system secretin GspD [Gammaproteobacteria bacterium]
MKALSTWLVRTLAILLLAALAQAQQAQRITPNFKDADIQQIAEAVSAATGKTFIIDPRVRAQVTMLSSTAMSPAAFYEAFLSILQVYGFVAVPTGNVVKIVPDANARAMPAIDLPDRLNGKSDEFVTQVLDVKNVSATQLIPILRPLVAQYGNLAAYPASNVIIISDHASNVDRIVRIIHRIDQVGSSEPEIVPLHDASAAEIVRVVNSLYQGPAAAEGAAVKVVADERSNSVIIAGEQSQRLKLRALIAHLDTPLESGGDTRVRYLHYADAEKIAPKLKEQITGIAQSTAAPGGAGAPAGGGGSPLAQAERNAMVWADPANNALVITAPPKIMRAVMDIIDKLDIRRPQVLVEAIVAEVDVDKSSELGINWAAFSNGQNIPVGSFVSPVGGTSIVDLAGAIQNPSNASTTLLQGTTIGIGRIAGTGINFAAMLRAIRGDTNTNVVATPSAVTMDNQEAELKVAQEVPFITGQFTNTTAVTGGAVNPFQTIQRQEVGTILKVTPTISPEGSAVMLKISIESSSIGQKPAGAVDLVTNKRTITTTVLIEDGGVVVLGGLIEDNSVKGEQRVPYLGSIPLIGLLFKTRNASSTKNNLIMFIRPKILRDQAQAAYETDLKYNYMRDQERGLERREALPLLPGTSRGRLEPLPQWQQRSGADNTPPPPPPAPGRTPPSSQGQPQAEPNAPPPGALPPGAPAPAPNATPAPETPDVTPRP